MSYSDHKLEKTINISLDYLIYKPASYDENKKWPLILSLHGSGERNKDIETVKQYGIHKILRENEDLPFLVVSPHCPKDESWEMQFKFLRELLDIVQKNYSIDSERIYLTGYSMGGYGTWNFAITNPELFAAIAPICGGAISLKKAVRYLKDTPIWVAHGDSDTIVDFEESKRIVDSLKDCNKNLIFKVYKNCDHEVCTKAYEDPELFPWLLKQRKRRG
ncbi:prolyl oligopeptidase family serine peptidase [Clostridium manihotivorum]|uniref:Alpha/beta hydrolase n=1 Tax=Clostridium manihotivorum TaxID=2320868 RepID=A0A3R5X2J0_9CLOT|nr:prolyl oligopeptidase family serine peptidase [Clostridium manihotivorum]QAA32908.1 alpha/beta hydrolase [Clostridium manihotivorum]